MLTPILAVYLLATLAPAIVRLVRGPSMGDRVLATTLIGTTGVAILALVAWDGGFFTGGAVGLLRFPDV